MCFSPVASFAAGTSLSVIGGATIAKTQKKSEIPFASVPLLFGIQQLIEGVIWISFGKAGLLAAMKFLYLLFSHVLWPTLIPLSILLMEPVRWRKWVLSAFVGLGIVVSVYFLYYLLIETVEVGIRNMSIHYYAPHFERTFIFSPYVAATCVCCLFSSIRIINIFGIVMFASSVVADYFYYETFISVWCFFGAILSAIIYLHFHRR